MALYLESTEESNITGEKDDCVVPKIHQTFVLFGCGVPTIILSLIFTLLWSLNTNVLTTGLFLGMLSLVTLSATVILNDMELNTHASKKDGKNTCCLTTSTHHLIIITLIVIICIIFFVSSIVLFVGASKEWPKYVLDQALAGIVALGAVAACALFLKGIHESWKIHSKREQKTGCWTCCCATCGVPTIAICMVVILWNSSMNASTMVLVPPGILVKTENGPTLHLYCTPSLKTSDNSGGSSTRTEYNKTLPTVLFLHGYGGSSLDAQGVREAPKFIESGARICSIDRPGYGWSQGYQSTSNDQQHFGYVAELTLEVLKKKWYYWRFSYIVSFAWWLPYTCTVFSYTEGKITSNKKWSKCWYMVCTWYGCC